MRRTLEVPDRRLDVRELVGPLLGQVVTILFRFPAGEAGTTYLPLHVPRISAALGSTCPNHLHSELLLLHSVRHNSLLHVIARTMDANVALSRASTRLFTPNKNKKKRIRVFTPDDRASHRVIEKQRREALNERFIVRCVHLLPPPGPLHHLQCNSIP